MLAAEAKWVARVVTALPADAFPLLNVGSQTREFRERDQPAIESQVFAPLRAGGRAVVHTDLREGDGIDVSGDLTNGAFRVDLMSSYGIRSILCCNVLEHVPDPSLLASSLAGLVDATGGHMIVTVPHDVPGDLVERGVWRGGSAMVMARALETGGHRDRRLYLYDTYEGMSEPTDRDVDARGKSAQSLLQTHDKDDPIWAEASLEEVRHNLATTGLSLEQVDFVKGEVEKTIPDVMPSQIAPG
jgi:Macrocin-O-methyltransferase (TylF)